VSTASPASGVEASVDADGGLPAASLAESLRFVGLVLVPTLARGLFSPRPKVSRRLAEMDADGRAISFLSNLRRHHGGQGIRLLGGRLVVVWGVDAIRDVLDRSADVYASDSGAKGKGMSHFQPDALTLSRGEEWRDRRAFNEAVLATAEAIHPDAERFLAVVGDEVGRLRTGGLAFPDWEELFDHIALRVIFGDRSRDDRELTDLLEKLMAEANRLVGLSRGDDYHELYGRLERKLADPEPGSLLAHFEDAPQTDRTRVVHQVPHWMFATRDTLATNTFRALAMLAASAETRRRAREEIEGQDPSSPATYEGLPYLAGCLSEAMRLWPTTPLLAREATTETTLAGESLDAGTQVMIVNAFNHRAPDSVEDADRFLPERWQDGGRDYRFNHLSNGAQDCPGGPLVYLLGRAVLAMMLERFEVELTHPSLDPARPLPYMLDHFELRFAVETRS
jgi:cytochrome P450